MATIELTTKIIKSLSVPDGKKKVDYFDIGCKNLLLEVRTSGLMTYYLRYRNSQGKPKQLKLGDPRDISLTQARALADKARNKIAMGEDPMEEKEAIRRLQTLDEFVKGVFFPVKVSKARSFPTTESIYRNHIQPRFGHILLTEVKPEQIADMVSQRLAAGAKPGTVDRALIQLRHIYNFALDWPGSGVTFNPAKKVPLLNPDNKKERYLDADEAKRLYEAVCQSQNPMLKYIVPMLILTGTRKREVLDAKWEDFDIPNLRWRIPMTKSGKPRHVPLSDAAVKLLESIPKERGVPWVFANPQTGKPYESLHNTWVRARNRAGLTDLRIHDLRHSFASFLVNSGRTLYEVQMLLGHTQVKTTQRYAHLSQDTLLAATNTLSAQLGGFITQPSPALAQIGMR